MASVEDRAVDSHPARQFDFWLGDWDLRWEPDGRGVNVITSILDDHAVLERFDGRPSIPLTGMSVSMFDAAIDRWRQVWVDSDGQYLEQNLWLPMGETWVSLLAPERQQNPTHNF